MGSGKLIVNSITAVIEMSIVEVFNGKSKFCSLVNLSGI